MNDKQDLEFTGERFTPESLREIWYEHYHRYALAATLVDGLDVLDAACGEGYGSAMLAKTANSVTAVDISAQTLEHANKRYGSIDNIEFIQADCAALDSLNKKYDRIISFETIEHLEQQEDMLKGFKRLLKADGYCLISSPDKAQYSDAANYSNPWHLRELYKDEFTDLLGQQFDAVQLLGQTLAFHSMIWKLDSGGHYMNQSFADDKLETSALLTLKPMYFLALCAHHEQYLPTVLALNLFADPEASVYQHYQHEIRKNMAAGEIIQQRDQELEKLRGQLAQLQLEIESEAQPGIFSRWLTRSLKRSLKKSSKI